MNKEYIMKFLDENKEKVKTMTHTDIYNYICDNLYITDYELARQCSIEYWNMRLRKM